MPKTQLASIDARMASDDAERSTDSEGISSGQSHESPVDYDEFSGISQQFEGLILEIRALTENFIASESIAVHQQSAIQAAKDEVLRITSETSNRLSELTSQMPNDSEHSSLTKHQRSTSQIEDTLRALDLHEANLRLSFDILYLTSYTQSAPQVESRLVKEGILVVGPESWKEFQVPESDIAEDELLQSERAAFAKLVAKSRIDELAKARKELEEQSQAIADQLEELSKAERQQWQAMQDLISERLKSDLLKKRRNRVKERAAKLNSEAAQFRAGRPQSKAEPAFIDGLERQIQDLLQASEAMSVEIATLRKSLDLHAEKTIDIIKTRLQRETAALKEAAEQCRQERK
jgi:hypothetical protein